MANSITILPFFILCSLFPPSTTCSSNETDLLSLLAFKSSIDLDPQGALSSWNSTLHFCSWNGIKCSRRHRDRVVEVNLRSQGLVGSLSPHLGNLSFLKTIILQNNSFHGPIPQEITLLRRVKVVEFSNNSFSGGISENMLRSPNLVYLSLIDNKLSGTIPAEIGSISKLQVLRLAKNKLSGPIPPSIGNITSLIELSLAYCGLKGEIPESIVQLKSLKYLLLDENSLTGTIPSGLFNISALQSLQVGGNQLLHGLMPFNIGLMLPDLKKLSLWGNQFRRPILVSISNASLLEQLDLSFNYFTGPMPRVGRLTHLRYFTFASNLIVDDISFIPPLTNSTKLEEIDVSNNLLSGSLPDSIANLSNHLSTLHMQMTSIHGNIPSGIGNLISLTSLVLFDNFLQSPIPMDIAKLYNLQQLDVGENRLTNGLPSLFGNLTFLELLYLDGNNLMGDLPPSIGNCTYLEDLDLSRNNFNGLIPPNIMNLSSLSIFLNLSYNAFVGSIPNEVGSLANLAALDLSNNRLSGVIPNPLSNCMSLQRLYLEGNLLQGEIPQEMNALRGLQELDLSRNNLSGPIPSFLGKLNLEKLNLSFNRLQGEVPISGVFMNKSSIFLDGNRELCGGISELKLPPCSASQKKNLSTLLKVLIPVLVAGGIACLMLLVFLIYKQSMSRRNQTSSALSSIGTQFMRLSYVDLLNATGGFSETNLVGLGRFGSVYKGILDDARTFVAVKVLNLVVKGASKSFVTECNTLRGIRHRNLVKILSVCESTDFQGNDFKALVYEFKANGSLEKWLYHNREQEEESCEEIRNLSMIQRLNIATDIAQAIEYLHFGTDSSIVHGDLKPSNILLDHEMTACVGDFGLAKIVSDIIPSHNESNTVQLGSKVPLVISLQSISMQGDVYSYGIVLLEMFTNKRPTDDLFKDHVNLHNFVSAALPDRVMQIVDPQFLTGPGINDMMKDCLVSILSIGVSCSKEIPRERMSMMDVTIELHKIQKLLYS